MKEWGVVFGHWSRLYQHESYMGLSLFAGLVIVLFLPNSMELKEKFKPNVWFMLWTILGMLSIFMLYRKSEFIYFNF